ncbi:MAG TPA: spore germination lipoprotein GerD [Bacillales bacterium]
MKRRLILITTCLMIALSGCASTNAQGGSKMDYQETKKMLIDLLKTDEGKKAIQDIMTSTEMKKQLLMDKDFVKKTIQETLTSKEGKKFWQSLIKDPKFAKTLAETMTKQNEKMLKNLMKDPEYQALMMDILKSPEMERQYLELMKTKTYRQQVQKIIAESFQSPLFKAKIASILKQVVDEELKKGNTGSQTKGKKQGSSQSQQSQA